MSKRRKTSNMTSSSSAPQFDTNRFVSLEASQRYDKLLEKKIIPEMGFDLEQLTINFRNKIQERGWEDFVKTPQPAVAAIVREFYANAAEHRDKKVFVRGKMVSFDSASINQIYKLQEVDDVDYQKLCDNPDYGEIITFLTADSVAWKLTKAGGVVTSFLSGGLRGLARPWHYFIIFKLMPTLKISSVAKERAVLNYAICMGMDINVGKTIENSILKAIDPTSTGGLGNPSLIYALCVEKGARGNKGEDVIHPKTARSRGRVDGFRRTRGQEQNPQPEVLSSSSSTQSRDLNSVYELMNQSVQQLFRRQDALYAAQQTQFQYVVDVLRRIHPDPSSLPPVPDFPPYHPADDEE